MAVEIRVANTGERLQQTVTKYQLYQLYQGLSWNQLDPAASESDKIWLLLPSTDLVVGEEGYLVSVVKVASLNPAGAARFLSLLPQDPQSDDDL